MEVALLPEYESGSLYGMGGSQSRTKWLSVSGILSEVEFEEKYLLNSYKGEKIVGVKPR